MKRSLIKGMVVTGLIAGVLALWPARLDAADQPQQQMSGKIDKVDPQGKTITLTSGTETKAFHVSPQATIVVGGQTQASLADLHVGDQVKVSYADQNGSMEATRIEKSSSSPTAPPSGPGD